MFNFRPSEEYFFYVSICWKIYGISIIRAFSLCYGIISSWNTVVLRSESLHVVCARIKTANGALFMTSNSSTEGAQYDFLHDLFSYHRRISYVYIMCVTIIMNWFLLYIDPLYIDPSVSVSVSVSVWSDVSIRCGNNELAFQWVHSTPPPGSDMSALLLD